MSIMDKLKKNSRIKGTEVLEDSVFFGEKDYVTTDVPMVNVALSGDIDGGLTSGLTVLAGPSKHFKTSFACNAPIIFAVGPRIPSASQFNISSDGSD